MYPTPIPQTHSPLTTPTYNTTPTGRPPGSLFEEVPISEPDLNKKPLRSAMKGAKNREMLKHQLEEKLRQKPSFSPGFSNTSSYPPARSPSGRKIPPEVAPRPSRAHMAR